MMRVVGEVPLEDTMVNTIRTTARTITTILDFCLNPTCLHSPAAKGCPCCSRGHGKRKAQVKTSSKRK